MSWLYNKIYISKSVQELRKFIEDNLDQFDFVDIDKFIYKPNPTLIFFDYNGDVHWNGKIIKLSHREFKFLDEAISKVIIANQIRNLR